MTIKSVCVLGNGQLGRMLKQAGEPLGIAVFPVGLDVDPNTIPYQQSVITAEIERWPDTPFTQILATHPRFVNRDIFPIIADRFTQKQLLDELHLPTAKWRLLTSQQDWPYIFSELGDLVIVKRRTGGYDGRGQWRIAATEPIDLPDDLYQQAIVEQVVPFEGEVSLIGARNALGDTVFYPLTYNLQQDGILKMSVVLPNQPLFQQQPLAPQQLSKQQLSKQQLSQQQRLQQQRLQEKQAIWQTEAETMLATLMNKLNYVGVMAMECFVVGNQLLINELAPRVHNSGHWTQNGASISQFELHLRAILGLPLPNPDVFAPSVMVNLIGTPLNLDWLTNALVHLHWYEKAVRPGRKVGHLNLTHTDQSKLVQALRDLADFLPADRYQTAIEWAQQKLSI
ncbi:5-(carboxyamino)imidazole ribonucleotide synthase [Orbaceae bacterium ESL0727]|nr:5-(carboxyamino)imidazole ribonucleotide synthase [Orbaceae bacterium ESL0727]